MTTYRAWVFDTAEDGPAALDALRADGSMTGEDTAVAISWSRDQDAPQFWAIDPPADPHGSQVEVLARRALLFDVVFLEPLRRATRAEAPDSGHGALRFGLTDAHVTRLRDALSPGRSVVVTSEAETRDPFGDILTGRRPVAQWTIDPESDV
jgi:hypothetical protein